MALSAQMERFFVDDVPMGYDFGRSQPQHTFGHYLANTAASFRSGMLIQLNASQEVIVCDGTEPFGFARYDKTTTLYGTVVDEYIQLTALVATNLAHANLYDPSGGAAPSTAVTVASATQGTGTVYTEGVGNDYNVNVTNGTIVRDAASTIVSGAYVYVTYMYQLTAAEIQRNGNSFTNSTDVVTQWGEKVSIATGPGIIFTTAYDPNVQYTMNLALHAGTTGNGLSGLVTVAAHGTAFIGNVFQIPSADDPYLGIKYVGSMLS